MSSRYNNPGQGEGSYSVDEMMARLKQGEREKRQSGAPSGGELVTREDGSQVVKVRRRKRRSKQPDKKKKNLDPRVKWAVFGSVIGLGILLVAATVFIIAKYNGRKFTEATEHTIAELSGAKQGAVSQLRVTPVSAKAAKFELEWDRRSFLKSAEFNNLRADIKATSFFGSDWIGEEVVASTGKVVFQTPASQAETGDSALVSPYRFGAYRCNQLDLHFGGERGAPAILGLQISQRKMVNEKYQFVFQDGLLKIENWPELKLASGVITLNARDADVEMLLSAGRSHKGELTVTGRIARTSAQPVVLDVKAKDYPVQELLGKELGRIIQGPAQSDMGSLTYRYDKPGAEGLSFVLPFNSTAISLSELPMLATLKDLTGNTNYMRPVFSNCRGNVLRTSEGVSLNNLNWISHSMITLQGNIHVAADKKLTGALDVGIPTSAFDKAPPAPFTGPKDGLYRARVKLSGTIHNPHDNLRELISAGSGKAIPPAAPGVTPAAPMTPEQQQEKAFENLSR